MPVATPPRFSLKQLNPMAALDERAAALKQQQEELARDMVHFRANVLFTVLGPDGAGSPAGLGRYYHATSREANSLSGASVETTPETLVSSGEVVPTHDGSGPVYQHEPEWIVRLPKKGPLKVTPQMIANRVAQTMHNSGLGLIMVALWEEGTPTFSAIYACNGRHVLCVQTTDAARQPVEHPAVLDPEGWRRKAADAIEAARAARRSVASAQPVPA